MPNLIEHDAGSLKEFFMSVGMTFTPVDGSPFLDVLSLDKSVQCIQIKVGATKIGGFVNVDCGTGKTGLQKFHSDGVINLAFLGLLLLAIILQIHFV
jgi:hypothetical protein